MQEGQSNDDTSFTYTGSDETYDSQEVSAQNAGVPLPALPDVSWSASEYVAHSKNASWYLMLLAGGIVLSGIILLITRDIFASVAVAMALLIVGAFAGRPPATKQYILSEEGIKIDTQMYHYDMFRSFSIVEEGGIDSIWLKPLKRFAPMVVMYFSPEQADEISNMIANFLPHEQRELDAIDRLSRRMRF